MATISLRKSNTRLPPEVNRVLYVRNLPFNISSEEMYDIFGKYGAIRQIRIGTNKDTRGTAFVVYEDIYDAKTAVDHLSGFNVANRYLIVLYYQQAKMSKKFDQKKKEEEIARMQEKYGVSTKDNIGISVDDLFFASSLGSFSFLLEFRLPLSQMGNLQKPRKANAFRYNRDGRISFVKVRDILFTKGKESVFFQVKESFLQQHKKERSIAVPINGRLAFFIMRSIL
ncbi:Pre-mRNA branch site p14-like protein [Morus notabilis]|uniref:Pre-mRNA branch site p14-like protein n=1 Tax=Morus notabilis TaxID=981085 RepID=W9SP23_9ROSA|nr:Pre-mRNA branch site p14-like protein [Morus notabilis]